MRHSSMQKQKQDAGCQHTPFIADHCEHPAIVGLRLGQRGIF
jgi:hypothetical protein